MNSQKDIQTVVTTHRMADVFPTIDTELGKVVSNQMDSGGGRTYSFNFELYATPPQEVTDALCARRCRDWIVYQGE